MRQWVPVAKESELPVGGSREVEFQGRLIALFNVGGKCYAIDGTCPHAGGPLGEGTLDGTIVTCPWHGWQFDVSTGQNVYNAGCVQECYEVKVEGGEVFLSVP